MLGDLGSFRPNPLDVEFSFLQTEGALRLARAYARIKQPSVRLQPLRLTEAIAGE